MLINLSDPPKSLTGSEKTQMLLSVDSIGFFISLMPSKQGSAIAFQEWISYAEGIKQDKIFLKDIGKKALKFSNSSNNFIVFYKKRFVCIIAGKDSEKVKLYAGKLSEELQ